MAPRFSELLRQRQPPTEPSTEAPAARPLPGSSILEEPLTGPALSNRRSGQTADERTRRDTARLPAAAAPARSAAAQAALPQDAHRTLIRLAHTVAHFCNDRAVSDSDGWQVRIPLRPDVLPDSTLDMSVSPHWIRMRFVIADPSVRQLVCTHSDELVRMLQAVLARPRDISISLD